MEYIQPMSLTRIGLGFAYTPPTGFYGQLGPVIGLAWVSGVFCLSGVIDADSNAEVETLMLNLSSKVQIIQPGQKIAQLIHLPCYVPEIEIVPNLTRTGRHTGSFGSSGLKGPYNSLGMLSSSYIHSSQASIFRQWATMDYDQSFYSSGDILTSSPCTPPNPTNISKRRSFDYSSPVSGVKTSKGNISGQDYTTGFDGYKTRRPFIASPGPPPTSPPTWVHHALPGWNRERLIGMMD